MKHELKKYFSVNSAKSLLPVLNIADTPVLASCFDTTARDGTRAHMVVVPTRAQQGWGGLIQRAAVKEGQSSWGWVVLLSEAWVTVHTLTFILPVASRRDIIAFLTMVWWWWWWDCKVWPHLQRQTKVQNHKPNLADFRWLKNLFTYSFLLCLLPTLFFTLSWTTCNLLELNELWLRYSYVRATELRNTIVITFN